MTHELKDTHSSDLIGPVDLDVRFVLQRYPNGGWDVRQQPDQRCPGGLSGAYSNAQDLLDALASVLLPGAPEGEDT